MAEPSSPAPRQACTGYLERANGGFIEGWAISPDGGVPSLSVWVDGIPRRSFRPLIHRPDLDEIAGPDNRAGFKVWVADLIPELATAEVAVGGADGKDPLNGKLDVPASSSEQPRFWLADYPAYYETFLRGRLASNEDAMAVPGYRIISPKEGQMAEGAPGAIGAWARHTGAALLYADDDSVGADGIHSSVRLKPGWDATLEQASSYTSGIQAIREDVAAAVNLHLPESLALQVDALGHGGEIRRIPEVLWHWDGAPPAGGPAGPPPPQPGTLVSIIVPTKDQPDYLIPCVRSVLEKTSGIDFELILVDHQTTDQRAGAFLDGISREDPRVRVIPFTGGFNYPALNHAGVEVARGDVLVFLNNDTEVVTGDWLRRLAGQLARGQVGAAGARLLYGEDGTVQHAGLVLGVIGAAFHKFDRLAADEAGYLGLALTPHEVSGVTGACMAVRKNVFEEAGGFDEEHLQVALNDVDTCLSIISLGWKIVYEPRAVLIHHKSKSRADDAQGEPAQRFAREQAFVEEKWGDQLDDDRYFHPWWDRDVPPYLALRPPPPPLG